MTTEVYTVLEFHADGSHGVDVAKLHGTFRHVDDAYLKLKQLVAEARPRRGGNRGQSYKLPIRELSADEVLKLEARTGKLERQRRKIGNEIVGLTDQFTRLEDELYEAGASEAEVDAKLAHYQQLQKDLKRERGAIDAELAALHDVNNITITKIGGNWYVVGGYSLEEDAGHRYGYFFENEIVASASFYKGEEGTRFFILSSSLQ